MLLGCLWKESRVGLFLLQRKHLPPRNISFSSMTNFAIYFKSSILREIIDFCFEMIIFCISSFERANRKCIMKHSYTWNTSESVIADDAPNIDSKHPECIQGTENTRKIHKTHNHRGNCLYLGASVHSIYP